LTAVATPRIVHDRTGTIDHMTRPSIRLCDKDIDRPGHVCAFFDSHEEAYRALIPYFRDGLTHGDRVLTVVDEATLPEHRASLLDAGIPTNANGDGVSIATSEETYVAGGRFDMERMVSFVEEHLVLAAREGRCVRTAGWMDWLERDVPGSERVMEYEARMNELTPTFDCTFLCVYNLRSLTGKMVADIMATHPYVILRGQIRKNPFYVEPEVYRKELLVREGS
jgi:hypothetical protein